MNPIDWLASRQVELLSRAGALQVLIEGHINVDRRQLNLSRHLRSCFAAAATGGATS